MSVLFRDFFTDVSGTLLQNHTPNIGTSWTRLSTITTAGDMVISTAGRGRVYSATSASYQGQHYKAEIPGSFSTGSWVMRCTVRWVTDPGFDTDAGLVAKANDGIIRLVHRSYYHLFIIEAHPTSMNGTSQIQTTWDPVVGRDYVFALARRTTAGTPEYAGYIDGEEILTWTPIANYSSLTTASIFLQSNATPLNNTNGPQISSFTFDNDNTQVFESISGAPFLQWF